ncbi:nijmegen breakage syndrome 1 protein-like isoform X2 [Chenopodium quinoa]|uniref:nijmegen breakage syndrome 1 protein-like isoform X2 n=1 Tax=Chenopodium quinoa TaxID=63459 RepID=UPI000B77E35B|nr:nijmegen breakage syndrome 1 protein-like isoform X2 [Chenopodium quinoa]
MVWGFFPVNPLSGEEKYYIYTKGTYKVGRKGCDVNIANDKGVSRIHAEIIVDIMESLKPFDKRSSSVSSKVRIRDCSKYGTFIVKDSGRKEKVHDSPGKEIYLKDGDLVKFGSGDLTYRFSYVPLNFYLCNFTSSQRTPFTQDKISSIGACVSREWTKECTHVLVDPFMPVTEEVIDIVLAKKPVILSTWLEIIAGTRIHNEIPSYSQYIPTLTLDGESVSIADTRTRENCLKGYTFVLGSANKYRFKDRVQSLLEFAGAKVLSITDFDNNIQDQVETDKCLALVIPADSAEKFCLDSSLSKVNEIKLISAVLSGYLDPSIIMSSSNSDAEAETSNHPSVICEELGMQNNTKKFSGTETTDCMNIDKKSANKDALSPEVGKALSFLEPKREVANARNDDLESWNLDILYSQKLIVRNTNTNVSVSSVSDGEVINFKCFRKTNLQSGNSYSNLVPYSKYPYTDSDYDKEVVEYVKDEKKRKQMEAMAEDLFKNERGRRRRVAGSIQEMLNRN